jgi:hypothetical protein
MDIGFLSRHAEEQLELLGASVSSLSINTR